MSGLRALPGGVQTPSGPGADQGPGRRLAPGAPRSPGTVPLDLARELKLGEAVVWWNEKAQVSWRPVAWTLAAGIAVLAGVSAFVPELWLSPWRELWKPVAAVLSPAALVFGREWFGRRAVLVTDTALVEVDARGNADRLSLRNIRRVRRDPWTGGVVVEGEAHRVRIPPALVEDARRAVASQLRGTIRADGEGPLDTVGWLPR